MPSEPSVEKEDDFYQKILGKRDLERVVFKVKPK